VTREHKLALIIGFSLVLIVGVLVSDHLSQASRVQLDGSGADDAGRIALTPVEPVRPAVRAPAPPVEAVERLNQRLAGVEPAPEPQPRAFDALAEALSAPVETLDLEPARRERSRVLDAPLAMIEQGAAELIHQGGNLIDQIGQVRMPTALQVVQRETPNAVLRYTVQPGDSLFQIARAHYGDGNLWRALAAANEGKIGADGTVRVGVSLVLPDRLEGRPVLSGWNSAGTQATPPARTASTPAPTPAPAASAPAVAGARTYTVQRNDTLGQIAQRELGTVRRMREILELNQDRIRDADDIRVGMTLRLPPR